MFDFSIRISNLSALSLIVKTMSPSIRENTGRQYLHGIWITPAPDGDSVLMQATNGHVLLAIRESTAVETAPAGNIFLHHDDLKALLAIESGHQRVANIRQGNDGKVILSGKETGFAIEIRETDLKPPKFERVIPKELPEVAACGQFATPYLKLACDIKTRLRADNMAIKHTGIDTPAVVSFGGETALMLIMPVKHVEPATMASIRAVWPDAGAGDGRLAVQNDSHADAGDGPDDDADISAPVAPDAPATPAASWRPCNFNNAA